jgi:AAA family ATP:ADP antiporter
MKSQNTKTSESADKNLQESSSLFKYLWPIHRHEYSKFFLTTLLMFCILFIQNVIRAEKDAIVNTMIGTEVIAFLKVWGVMPGSIMMAILYVKLINNFKAQKVFYIIISSFILFFALFAFWIFPNHESLHLSIEATESLISKYP